MGIYFLKKEKLKYYFHIINLSHIFDKKLIFFNFLFYNLKLKTIMKKKFDIVFYLKEIITKEIFN